MAKLQKRKQQRFWMMYAAPQPAHLHRTGANSDTTPHTNPQPLSGTMQALTASCRSPGNGRPTAFKAARALQIEVHQARGARFPDATSGRDGQRISKGCFREWAAESAERQRAHFNFRPMRRKQEKKKPFLGARGRNAFLGASVMSVPPYGQGRRPRACPQGMVVPGLTVACQTNWSTNPADGRYPAAARPTASSA